MNRRNFLRVALLGAIEVSAERALAGTLILPKTHANRPTQFMSHTVLSSRATLRAWTDPGFRNHLIANPNDVLANFWGDIVNELKFVVHENALGLVNLPLPAKQTLASTMAVAEVRDALIYETGGAEDLEYFLPADVIANAQLDPSYRQRLLKAPNIVLGEAGYELRGRRVIVHENTSTIHHLALPESPSSLVELASMEHHILNFAQAQTTTCCATGTCAAPPGSGNGCSPCHDGFGRGHQPREVPQDQYHKDRLRDMHHLLEQFRQRG